MLIKLKTLKSEQYEITIPSETEKISHLKQEIEKKFNLKASTIKLLYNGNVLKDEKLISDYHIKEGSVLILMVSKIEKKGEKEYKTSKAKRVTKTRKTMKVSPTKQTQ